MRSALLTFPLASLARHAKGDGNRLFLGLASRDLSANVRADARLALAFD
jgi:hypothetical protein